MPEYDIIPTRQGFVLVVDMGEGHRTECPITDEVAYASNEDVAQFVHLAAEWYAVSGALT